MKKVIGRKYVSSMGIWIFLGIFFFLLVIGTGIFVFSLVKSDYDYKLWDYQNGYFLNPTPPTEPIGWYVFIILVSLFVALFFLWLFLHLGIKEREGNKEAVIYDEKKKCFQILWKGGYLTIPVKSVTKIKVDDTHFMMVGKTPMFYHSSYGKLAITFTAGTKKQKIRTIEIQDVLGTAAQMEAILKEVKSRGSCSCPQNNDQDRKETL